MKIDLSILSVLSAALLIMFCVAGNEIILDNLSADVYLHGSSVSIDIHPVWIVYASQRFVFDCGAHAFAFGNVIVIGEHMRRCAYLEEYILAHERIHIQQFRALGPLIWPAQFFINIEPDGDIMMDWSDAEQPINTMWVPPPEWTWRWNFITLTFNKENT